MAETHKSFYQFYSKEEAKYFDLEDLLTKLGETDITNNYRSDMFCPECKCAQLTLVAKTSKHRAYLKRIPSSSHEENCSYNFEYASNRTVRRYIDSLSPLELKDKLDSIMRLLCNTKLVHDDSKTLDKNNQTKVSPMLIPSKNNLSKNLKSLRRKRIGAHIDESEFGSLFAFYGEVQLKVHCHVPKDEQKANTYFLRVLSKNLSNEWKIRTSVYLGTKSINIDEDSLYHMVFIGYPQKNKNGYLELKLVNNCAYKYKLIEQ